MQSILPIAKKPDQAAVYMSGDEYPIVIEASPESVNAMVVYCLAELEGMEIEDG